MKIEAKNHSFGNTDEVKLEHLSLDLVADFDSKSLAGTATWNFKQLKSTSQVVFDCKHMQIDSVWVNNIPVTFSIGESDEILGNPLIIPITTESTNVKIKYRTQPEAAALQWLDANQTEGQPFLFTQSQAILARTWVPCMDAPSIRFTYDAKIQCPPHLLPLMSASNPQIKNTNGSYYFEMRQPIPSYLLALCIGDLAFMSLGENTGVYAQPATISKAYEEFQDLNNMIYAAEKRYGPYKWGRYDIVVLPASFPFGGMENPRLTFATPTIITGDKSLVSLIAHELAHSWSGNLVTNETWNDFWLNEGFTVYFEDRIMEDLYGRKYADMLAIIGLEELQETVQEFMQTKPNDTKLYLDLKGRNPDDGVSDIAYEKGRFFLLSLEKLVGREKFDAFLLEYFNTFAFKTINTNRFIEYLHENLLQTAELAVKARVNEWIFETGLPDNCPQIESEYLHSVEQTILNCVNGKPISSIDNNSWTTHHYLHFLRNIPANYFKSNWKQLDEKFNFMQTTNSEIACDWLKRCIEADVFEAKQQLLYFLTHVGRRKFLSPLYKAMIAKPEWVVFAKEVFENAKSGYHAVAYETIESFFEN